MKKVLGFSLVEVLIALSLVGIVTLALIDLYLHMKSNYQQQQSFLDGQEEARFITTLLTRRIHQAGNARCVDQTAVRASQAIWGHAAEMIIGECMHYQGRYQFIRMRYFLGDTHRKNPRGNVISALYQQPLPGRREELVSGISEIKIRYGVGEDKPQDINRYVAAAAVTHWNQVRSVEIVLWFDSLPKPWHLYVSLREPL